MEEIGDCKGALTSNGGSWPTPKRQHQVSTVLGGDKGRELLFKAVLLRKEGPSSDLFWFLNAFTATVKDRDDVAAGSRGQCAQSFLKRVSHQACHIEQHLCLMALSCIVDYTMPSKVYERQCIRVLSVLVDVNVHHEVVNGALHLIIGRILQHAYIFKAKVFKHGRHKLNVTLRIGQVFKLRYVTIVTTADYDSDFLLVLTEQLPV